MINTSSKSTCSGCSACLHACPVDAIKMIPDREGFSYPKIDIEACVNCGKCKAACPILDPRFIENVSQKNIALAARSKNETIRQQSSSGGIFTEIATYILASGGVVFGAAFDKDFKVVHIAIENESEIYKLRGSKYVQSDIGNTYVQAKEYLQQGRIVLFSGTPCQIAGLYSYLNHKYENLYTQDIICHGVPSPMVWKNYIEYRESKVGKQLENVSFRDKKHGWRNYSLSLRFSNQKTYDGISSEDFYLRGFMHNFTLRPSCYSCAFKSKQRQSDFTLADFWGVEKVCPEFDDDMGTSLVVLNSEKACELIERIKVNIEYKEVDFDGAIKYNSAMTSSVTPHQNRENFFVESSKHGFYGVVKYVKAPLWQRLKRIIKSLIKRGRQ